MIGYGNSAFLRRNFEAGLPPINTVAPVISGGTALGSVLTTTNGTWTGTPTITYTYQWYRGATLIVGATNSTYTIVIADSAAAITCNVTATNGFGFNVATSNVITAQTFTAPVNTVAPAITGTAQEGQILTSSTGTWTGTPTITYAYQWKRNGSNILSATNSTYTLVTADVSQSIKCTVTATNGIGNASADSNSVTPIAAVDPDAQAFITAAAITDPTQQAAINTLVVDLKGYSIWTKMKALYPIVGGTAAQHKFNLKDPRDLDVAFRLVFNGGWTHSATGILPGVNGYADTKLVPSTAIASVNSNSLGYYSGSNLSETSADPCNMGAFISVTQALTIVKPNTTLNSRINGTGISYSSSLMKGFFSGSRQSSTLTDVYINGSQVATGNSGGTLPTNNVLIGTISIDPSNNPYGAGYVKNDFRFAYLSDGLSDTDAANLYTAVQAFQTTLGRSIGTQTVSDADAQAFVTNAGIVDQVEANAINNLVIGMKADGLWTKMKAVYPMVGGTATTNKFNLKNPLDTDAAFRLTFTGGWTHSNNGATPNGTNAFANSFLAPSTNLSLNNAHVSFYSRSNTVSNTSMIGLNPLPSTNSYINLYPSFAGNMFFRMNSTGTGSIAASTSTDGYYIVNRISSTEIRCSKNASTFTQAAVSGALSSSTIRLGGDGVEWDNRQCAFASIGDGLTDTDRTNINTRVTTFQTTLNRNI